MRKINYFQNSNFYSLALHLYTQIYLHAFLIVSLFKNREKFCFYHIKLKEIKRCFVCLFNFFPNKFVFVFRTCLIKRITININIFRIHRQNESILLSFVGTQ